MLTGPRLGVPLRVILGCATSCCAPRYENRLRGQSNERETGYRRLARLEKLAGAHAERGSRYKCVNEEGGELGLEAGFIEKNFFFPSGMREVL